MSDINMEVLKAEIRVKLCYTVPMVIGTADEWCAAIDKVTKDVMEVIEKHNEEGA